MRGPGFGLQGEGLRVQSSRFRVRHYQRGREQGAPGCARSTAPPAPRLSRERDTLSVLPTQWASHMTPFYSWLKLKIAWHKCVLLIDTSNRFVAEICWNLVEMSRRATGWPELPAKPTVLVPSSLSGCRVHAQYEITHSTRIRSQNNVLCRSILSHCHE